MAQEIRAPREELKKKKPRAGHLKERFKCMQVILLLSDLRGGGGRDFITTCKRSNSQARILHLIIVPSHKSNSASISYEHTHV